MRNRTRLCVVALLTVLTLVLAVSSPSHAYFGAKVGGFLPNDDEEGLQEFDSGTSVELFYGQELSPNFAVEAAVGYYFSEASMSGYDSFYDVIVDVDATVSAIPLTLTGKGKFPLGPGFSLFAGAGIGAYFAKVEEDISAASGAVDLSVSDDDTATAVGFHAVAGAEYQLANGMALLGEFKWFTVEPGFALFEDELNDYPGDVQIGGIVLSLGLRF